MPRLLEKQSDGKRHLKGVAWGLLLTCYQLLLAKLILVNWGQANIMGSC